MEDQLRALKWRAWHRGTKEADLMIGGFYDAHHANWDEGQMRWFADLLNEQDVDIMAWGIGTLPVPPRFDGPMMEAFRKLDFIRIAR